MNALPLALFWAALLAHYERNPTEVERLASDVIELSTRQNFATWLTIANILRGWAHLAFGKPAEGIAWVENGIGDYRATVPAEVGREIFNQAIRVVQPP